MWTELNHFVQSLFGVDISDYTWINLNLHMRTVPPEDPHWDASV